MSPAAQPSPIHARLLVIDTATEACSVALFTGEQLVAADHAVLGRGHAERLVPMIAALPDRGRADAVLVNCGPGSFTGVRVGLAAARALGLAWNVPVRGYSTHDLVAAMALADARAVLDAADAPDTPNTPGVDVVMAGGHGEYFCQSFDGAGLATDRLSSLDPDIATARCAQQLVAGSMAAALVAARGFGMAVPIWPDARAALLLPPVARGLAADPVYGRGADARPMAVSAPAPISG